MADLDDLIDELFPGSGGPQTRTPPCHDKAMKASQADWDVESNDDDSVAVHCAGEARRISHAPSSEMKSGPAVVRREATRKANCLSNLSTASSGPASTRTKGQHEQHAAKHPAARGDAHQTVRRTSGFDEDSSNSGDDVHGNPDTRRDAERPAATPPSRTAAHHDFDDSDDETHGKDASAAKTGSSHRHHPSGRRTGRLSGAPAAHRGADEAEVALERPSTAQRVLFTVPFPSAPSSDMVGPPCPSRCMVSSSGCKSVQHPTIEMLRQVAAGVFDTSCNGKAMLVKKGAFHDHNPKVGNGVWDNGGDPSERGGCPNVFCLKCHHTVVRLQGAQWCDGDGSEVDLYLTTRNFYPDWSRLATSNVVGGENDEDAGLALKENPDTAAYCCQCSWLTVKVEKALIETSLTAAVTYKQSEQGRPFATVLPRRADEERRPPLWVCKGHPL